MSIPGAASPLLLATTAAAAAYQISRSLRFNSADSAYLDRTPSSAGNRKTWTWSGWIKRSKFGSDSRLFDAYTSQSDTGYLLLGFSSANKLIISGWGTNWRITSQVFRDPSAFFHLVVAFDVTQSTASDRIKFYINGQQVNDFDTNNAPAQDTDHAVNGAFQHNIGRYSPGPSQYFDGYLADVHFIDGQALAPTDFGETDDNNNWNPKAYSGTYGTNGFHLDFSDTSDLGADAAGSNDWTPNNLVGSAPGLSTANQGFDAVTYSGNGGTQSISSLNFQPDLVWIKNNNGAHNNMVFDVVRGAGADLQSNSTASEGSAGSNDLTSFDSSGFSLGSNNAVNQSGRTYVAWCWKAGGSASSNTYGTITSSVSGNTTYGFSIVTYTGTGSAGATVGHGLGSVPKFILVKNRSGTDIMVAYHASVGNTGALRLTTAATDTGYNWWNSTTPSSSVFTIGNTGATNNSSDNYVAYCWTEVSGFSKFGTYSGLSTTLGPKVVTGFKPRLVVVKRTDSTGNWTVYDSARSLDKDLKWNTSEAEGTAPIIFHSDGFQLNYNTGSVNTSGGSYIYMAFASKPDQSAIDSLIDTPTNYEADSGNNGGNYCTLNPLDKSSQTNINLSNGNLECSNTSSSGQGRVDATFAVSSGKWYFEATVSGSSSYHELGIIKTDQALAYGIGFYSGGYSYLQTGNKFNGNGDSSYGASYTNGDTIGVAFDLDAGNLVFYKNGVSQGTAFTGLSGEFSPTVGTYSSAASFGWTVNFGQRPFAYTPPTNHKSLCTQNLTDPTIADGSTAMDVTLYNGNSGTAQTISGINHSPDFVWYKHRSAASSHGLFDIVRGANNYMNSNGTGAQQTVSGVTAFNSDGFSLGTDTGANGSGTWVAWTWDAGTTTATNNTAGSITPTGVRANQSAGFSIVKWDATSSAETVGHGLNVAPEFILMKTINTTGPWLIYHKDVGASKYMDFTNVAPTTNNLVYTTAPTSSVFSPGNGIVNTSIYDEMIAYCFAPVAGYSAFGTVLGTGSSDGGFAYTGFRPRFLLWRNADANGNWGIIDAERDHPDNIAGELLFPNLSNTELTFREFDFLSNGIKLRYSYTSGHRLVFMAFAEHPFKTSRAV